MFSIRMEMRGDFDLDNLETEIECPRCLFSNPVRLKQVRLRDVAICRGCKSNLQLDDGMNSLRKARRSVQRQLNALQDQIKRINRSFR
jgi:transposase-like protein